MFLALLQITAASINVTNLMVRTLLTDSSVVRLSDNNMGQWLHLHKQVCFELDLVPEISVHLCPCSLQLAYMVDNLNGTVKVVRKVRLSCRGLRVLNLLLCCFVGCRIK